MHMSSASCTVDLAMAEQYVMLRLLRLVFMACISSIGSDQSHHALLSTDACRAHSGC